jgi:hypothetical protein
LIDLLKENELDLDQVEVVVLDEADRMADDGFTPQVEWILRKCTAPRQTMLFSATLDGDVGHLVTRYMKNPVEVAIDAPTDTVGTMYHLFLAVHHMDKDKVVASIASGQQKTIVFCQTKRTCDRVEHNLQELGVKAAAIHGDLSQVAREKAHQTAMETIANEKRFLDLVLNIQCPNGVEVKATARLDTGANTDVCSPELSKTLKCNKVQWGSAGGHYVEVCGGTAHQPTGMLEVPVVVPARQLGLSRTVELDVDAVIMPIPQGTELLLGLPTLLNSGLLTAVMAGMTETKSAAGVPDSRNEDDDPIGSWESIDRADEYAQDTVMPAA